MNGKVERPHRTDQQEFYQLLDYTDEVDLIYKINEWEKFYNFSRLLKAHGGLTPFDIYRAKMNIGIKINPNT